MAIENFAIAIGYNLIFVPLAVAGHVTPLLAALAMSGSSLAVTGNALRLRTRKVSLS
jgi:P-type Cu2+ transporter